MTTYLKPDPNTLSPGFVTESTVVGATTSAANAGLIPELNAAGTINPALLNAAVNGANKVLVTDANGKIDPTTIPAGVGIDQNIITATEALSAGDFVNVHAGGVRKADAANARPAHGFVLSAVANGQPATVIAEGTNTGVTGLTMGPVWLNPAVPGGATNTRPNTAGQTRQPIGVAVSATAINFQQGIPVLLGA